MRKVVQTLRPELVVHLADPKIRGIDMPSYRKGYDISLIGSINFIEACAELSNIKKFVFLGSCEEYGYQKTPYEESAREYPVSAYGVSKLAVTKLLEALAQTIDFPSVILRPSVVYGPGQKTDMFLPALIKTLLSNERFSMTSGKQTRDYLYIKDLIEAIVQTLIISNINGRIINVSSAKPIHIADLAIKVEKLIGCGAETLLDFGKKEYRPWDTMNYCATNLLAKELLDWSPSVSLKDGLRQTIESFHSSSEVI